MTPQTTQARRVRRPEDGKWRRGVAEGGRVSESSRYTETKSDAEEEEENVDPGFGAVAGLPAWDPLRGKVGSRDSATCRCRAGAS